MTATRPIHELKAAVVGTGFVGMVHIDAIRRLGVEVVGVAGLPQDTVAAAAFAQIGRASCRDRVSVLV